jgi:hypothetical protein
MVDDGIAGFICDVCIIDAEVGVKPIDFIGHELAGLS